MRTSLSLLSPNTATLQEMNSPSLTSGLYSLQSSNNNVPARRGTTMVKAIQELEPEDTNNSAAVRVALITAIASIAVALITSILSYYTQRHLQDAQSQIQQLNQSTAGSLTNGQKLCRVLLLRSWRDSVIVPQSWNINLCNNYSKKLGGTGYQLGCVTNTGVSLGGENGTLPEDNSCGWN